MQVKHSQQFHSLSLNVQNKKTNTRLSSYQWHQMKRVNVQQVQIMSSNLTIPPDNINSTDSLFKSDLIFSLKDIYFSDRNCC